MRYFLEAITLSEVKLYAVEKKDIVKWCNEHQNAKCIDEKEYNRLNETVWAK